MKTKTRTDKGTQKLIFFAKPIKQIKLDNLTKRGKGKNSLIQKIRNKNDKQQM